MALHKVAVAAKDGQSSPVAIPGGVQQHDTSGTGAGPNQPLMVQVDSAGNEIHGLTTDAASIATDATPLSAMSVRKQISASVQIIAAAISSAKMAVKAAAADFADGAITTLGLKADAASTATDTTAITAMSVFKQISKSVQGLLALWGAATDAKNTATDTTSITVMQAVKQISASIQAAAASLATLVSGQSPAGQQAVQNAATVVQPSDFKAYPKAASQTAQLIGATGAAGDWLDGIMVIPGTTSPGAVSYQDGAGTAVVVFAGGATSVGDLKPFYIPIGAPAATGWKFTTGANVTAIFYGKHT